MGECQALGGKVDTHCSRATAASMSARPPRRTAMTEPILQRGRREGDSVNSAASRCEPIESGAGAERRWLSSPAQQRTSAIVVGWRELMAMARPILSTHQQSHSYDHHLSCIAWHGLLSASRSPSQLIQPPIRSLVRHGDAAALLERTLLGRHGSRADRSVGRMEERERGRKELGCLPPAGCHRRSSL